MHSNGIRPQGQVPWLVRVIILSLVALGMATSTASAQVRPEDEDRWFFRVVPYLWAVNIDAVNTVGIVQVPVQVDFDDLTQKLDSAFSVHFEFGKKRWTGVLDWQRVELKDEQKDSLGPPIGDLTIDFQFEMNMGEALATWRATELENRHAVEVLFGTRYNRQAQVLDLESTGIVTPSSGSFDESWFDPIVGVRYWVPFGQKRQHFWFNARFDWGGFGVSSDHVINLGVGGGWNITRLLGLILEYRYMDIDYDNNKQGTAFWAFDGSQEGVLLGLSFAWQ